MLDRDKFGRTICRQCGHVLQSPEEWSAHRARHVVEYWARQPEIVNEPSAAEQEAMGVRPVFDDYALAVTGINQRACERLCRALSEGISCEFSNPSDPND